MTKICECEKGGRRGFRGSYLPRMVVFGETKAVMTPGWVAIFKRSVWMIDHVVRADWRIEGLGSWGARACALARMVEIRCPERTQCLWRVAKRKVGIQDWMEWLQMAVIRPEACPLGRDYGSFQINRSWVKFRLR
ncbi:hypothetical protein KI387_043488, partial [Taxus chinensis]